MSKFLDYTGLAHLWAKIKSKLQKDYDRTVSRGLQLVTNGYATMGDNTNFSSWTYDGANACDSGGSFTCQSTEYLELFTDDFFPVSPRNTYELSITAKSLNGLPKLYTAPVFYDIDKNKIAPRNHMYMANTLTTLAQDLENGDTVVHLTDISNWNVNTSTRTWQRGFIFWNYKNSFGYEYPENTYSRNVWSNLYKDANVNKTSKTITLTSAWSHGTIPAGTKVSQSASGTNYKYRGWNGNLVPADWTTKSGIIGGVDYSGQNALDRFPPGAAYCKIAFLWNYNGANDQIWATNIEFKETTSIATDEKIMAALCKYIAPEWVPDKGYEIGALVMHEGELYYSTRFQAPSAFEQGHFVEATLSDVIEGIRADM